MYKKIIFTGGHHTSLLPVIDSIRINNNSIKMVWIGRKFINNSNNLSPEYIEVKKRKIKFYNINSGKLYRFNNPIYILNFIKNLLLIPIGFITALIVLKKEKPTLIVSFGGYIAVPVVIVGFMLKIKSVTHEQTTIIGLANKIISTFVKHIYVSWPIDMYNFDPKVVKKVIFTGLPLRQDLFDSRKAKKFFTNSKDTIFITGGKIGSSKINDLFIDNHQKILNRFNVIWQTGGRESEVNKSEQLFKHLDESLKKSLIIRKYLEEGEFDVAFKEAKFLITRSGGHIVYETIVFQKPAIFIPIKIASNNEQLNNAYIAKKLSNCDILEEDDIDNTDVFEELLSFSNKLDKMKVIKKTNQIFLKGRENLTREILKNC